MEVPGYAGKILYVDLSSETIKKEELDRNLIENFIGGGGINMRLAYDFIEPSIKPLSEDNPLILGAGALTGTRVPSASKVFMTSKQPLNGAIGTATGDGLAHQFKWAGYDHVVITGKADKPVYLGIFDEDIEILDAGEIWGEGINKSTDILYEKHEGATALTIGPAGENLLRLAMPFVDKISTLGRGGFGAIMGSKNLKAVISRGTNGIKEAYPGEITEIRETMESFAKMNPVGGDLKNYGYGGAIVDQWIDTGLVLKENNTAFLTEEDKEKLGEERFKDAFDTKSWCAPGCISPDKVTIEPEEEEFEDEIHTATSANIAFLASVFNSTLEEGAKLHYFCNDYGIDELDFSYMMELLFYLKEQGDIKEKDVGIDLTRSFETGKLAIERLVNRDGIFEIAGGGIEPMLEKLGVDKDKAVLVKGLWPPFDPRALNGVEAFAYLTCQRGAISGSGLTITANPGRGVDSIMRLMGRLGATPEAIERAISEDSWNVGRVTPYVENFNTAMNSLGLCVRFWIGALYMPPFKVANVYNKATGIEKTTDEIIEVGERTWNLQKVMNVKEGFSREDDEWSKKVTEEPLSWRGEEVYLQDYAKTHRIDKDEAESILSSYYEERRWNPENSVPTKEKLIDLGLDFAVEDLEDKG